MTFLTFQADKLKNILRKNLEIALPQTREKYLFPDNIRGGG
jgi:hypothetical protein